MHKPGLDMRFAKTGAIWAAGLLLVLTSSSVAADPKPQPKPADAASRTPDVGEILYGSEGGAWGSPSRAAARLARQKELSEKATAFQADQMDRQPVTSATPTLKPAAAATQAPALLQTPEEPGHMASWLIPLGGGVVIGLSVAGVYAWSRSRRAMNTASGQLLVASVVLPLADASTDAPVHMTAIPSPPPRRVARSTRSVQPRMMNFPRSRSRSSRDLYGDALRNLQMLGIVPVPTGQTAPGMGRPSYFASGVTDEVQMYGGGSDPIPNYAYLEDAPRMLAQVQHQKAAEAMVWSNQNWQQ